MKKRRIVLASVLKPVDETRMFEKLGATLADSGDYEVTVIGMASIRKTAYPNTRFLTHHFFKRISLLRLLAPWRVLQKFTRVKPDVIIICTHELLLIALAYKLFFKTTVIYDVQENYYRNIRYTKAFPVVLRVFVACWVRMKEKFTAPFVDWFLLAERGYQQEFSFYKQRYTVIENKFRKPDQFKRPPASDKTKLLFSGTLADSTGVFQAIEFAIQLHRQKPGITLTIIGYCAQPSTLQRLREAISNYEFIFMVGGDEPVSHPEIIAAIAQADFGIIYYTPSPHTENAIPTKLYEYMGCELPILLQNHRPWIALTHPYPAAIVINDFGNIDASEILQQMKQTTFYSEKPTDVYWDSEEPKLLKSIQTLKGFASVRKSGSQEVGK